MPTRWKGGGGGPAELVKSQLFDFFFNPSLSVCWVNSQAKVEQVSSNFGCTCDYLLIRHYLSKYCYKKVTIYSSDTTLSSIIYSSKTTLASISIKKIVPVEDLKITPKGTELVRPPPPPYRQMTTDKLLFFRDGFPYDNTFT